MAKGRKPATGRFETREELVEAACRAYRDTDQNVAQIARWCRVSDGVIHKIIDGDEGRQWRANNA
mgnify:CR=1 FL=1